MGGFPTGWTGYAPLSIQATRGHGRLRGRVRADGHLDHPGRRSTSSSRSSATGRPACAGAGCRCSSGRCSPPSFLHGAGRAGAGRRHVHDASPTGPSQTAFFVNQLGGSSYLYEDLFWFFGHPEVYILALPGFGIVSEIIPVFCRKPLFGYKIAAAGMIGVASCHFFVWQHHLFDSGINPDMRPLFMLTTELISIPTGFIYLVAMGTFWKAKIRFTVPMLFALGILLQLPDRRHLRGVPVRRARRTPPSTAASS